MFAKSHSTRMRGHWYKHESGLNLLRAVGSNVPGLVATVCCGGRWQQQVQKGVRQLHGQVHSQMPKRINLKAPIALTGELQVLRKMRVGHTWWPSLHAPLQPLLAAALAKAAQLSSLYYATLLGYTYSMILCQTARI